METGTVNTSDKNNHWYFVFKNYNIDIFQGFRDAKTSIKVK